MAQKPRTKPTPGQMKAQAKASLKVLEARARRQFREFMATADRLVAAKAAERRAPYPKKDGAA